MKAYQLKMIVKNTKPPVWKRFLLPAGITFSQLEVILEEVAEETPADCYEFEFYQAGIHLREWREGERGVRKWNYDYRCASDTYINSLFGSEKWFTFRIEGGREYRIEIEKEAETEQLYPVIVRQKGIAGQEKWSDMEAVNRKLKEMFPIVYGEPDYSNYYELRERLEQGTMGLRGAEQPADRTDRNQGSVNSSLKEMAQLFSEYMDIQTAAENGASRVELERSVSAFEEKLRQKQEELLQRGRLRGSVAGPAPERAADIRKPTICGWLEEESKEELKERADELSLIHIKSLKKKELAEKIANEMLRPSVMKKRMAFLSDEEIRAFETAIEKGGYYPDREELTLLEPLYDLLYVLIYADDYVAVPQEAAQAYQRINTPEFQRVRQENCWMSRCLDVTGMLYRVASVRVACRLLSVCIGREIRGKEFKSIYHSMPEEKRTCVLQDGLLIDETIFRRDTWQTYQNAQADVPFYIPKKEEIQEYSTYGYPDSDDRYRGLKEFLLSEGQMDAEDVRDSLSEIWEIFSSGIDFTESMAMVEQAGFRFTEKGKQKRFAGLLEDAFRHTRTFIYKGWTEAEIRARQGIES